MNLPTNNNNHSTSAAECDDCGAHNLWFLHNIRVRGSHRRFCTSCVLRLHPASFCPSCFVFYDTTPPPPSKGLSCSNCSSFTHSHCATSPPPKLPFLCPPCANPNFAFFDIDHNNRAIDKKLAVVLLCAAKIASASMGKAVVAARAEAERRVREAAVARKRAREALEHVAFIVSKERARNKERSVEVENSKAEDMSKVENLKEALDACKGNLEEKTNNGEMMQQQHLQNSHVKDEGIACSK